MGALWFPRLRVGEAVAAIRFDSVVAGADVANAATRYAVRDLSDLSVTDIQAGSASGLLVGGRYELRKLLGTGGVGVVYLARDRELDDLVALKILRSRFGKDVDLLRREVKLARLVTHRNVARTFELGEHGGDRFLTMEYVDGESLRAILAHKKRLSVSETCRILVSVCEGAHAAHEAGIVHRDLKPDNVMIAGDGRVVVTDFGIAWSVQCPGEDDGFVAGTPAYMSPEQVRGAEPSVRSDIYSLGVMAHEMVTGELPWPGRTVAELLDARLHTEPRDSRANSLGVSDELAMIILRSLSREPSGRLASARELADAFQAASPSVCSRNRVTIPVRPREEDIPSIHALDLYGRARDSYNGLDTMKQAAEFSAKAAEAAPTDPVINAGLALALIRHWFLSEFDKSSLVPRAREAIRISLERAPERGEPHLARGLLLLHSGDPIGAAGSLRTAIVRDPSPRRGPRSGWTSPIGSWASSRGASAAAHVDGARPIPTPVAVGDGTHRRPQWRLGRKRSIDDAVSALRYRTGKDPSAGAMGRVSKQP